MACGHLPEQKVQQKQTTSSDDFACAGIQDHEEDVKLEYSYHFRHAFGSLHHCIFQDADHTFGGFTDLDWAKNVASRIARLSGVWCCGKGPETRFSYGMDSRVEGLMAAGAASF